MPQPALLKFDPVVFLPNTFESADQWRKVQPNAVFDDAI